MCGITGYINTNSGAIKDTTRILSMLKVQQHRGPDDTGIRAISLDNSQSQELSNMEPVTVENGFEGVVGFNRLSIMDLSANGHQPMASQDGRVILAFNGEIYNAFDYKKELEAWGYRFKSNTDTEVVLALYLKYGYVGMLNKLNGMFAIVIADLPKKELYIARDRFGIKPMYYVNTGSVFAFSSELKSFKYLDGYSFSLNKAKLDEYLLFRNTINDTLFEGINSLKAGHYLKYKSGESLQLKKYFDIDQYDRVEESSSNLSEVQKKLETWLHRSVQSQLMSDVKLGCQLSGGVDSSLVTWLANKNKNDFESVSIVFDDERFSEEKYIDEVRDKLNIPARKFLLDSDYYLDHLENATWHLESPLNHPNTIGIYKLSQRAKDYVTVLLSGEGADEVFGGYERFNEIKYPYSGMNILREIKNNRRNPLAVFDYFSAENRAVMATAFMKPLMAQQLCPDFNVKHAAQDRKDIYAQLSGSRFDRQVKYELLSYLPDLLIRQDKMSMAHSIENRVPFLDNEVVSRSFSIPENYLLNRKNGNGVNTEKYLLKKMTADVFGNDFAFRNKMGFGIPLKEFFSQNKFNEYLNHKVLPGVKNRGIFSPQLISKWVANVNGLKPSELDALWVVIAFETWASVYLDGNY